MYFKTSYRGLRICDAVFVEQRLQHIAKELIHYDIVCLQEVYCIYNYVHGVALMIVINYNRYIPQVWERKDYIFLLTELKPILQYSHHFTRLCLDVGLQ